MPQVPNDLSLQLDLLTRDYGSKLISYLEAFACSIHEQKALVADRNDILPVHSSMYEAKMKTLAEKCHSVINRVLENCKTDATELLESHYARAKKKTKHSEESIEILNRWLQKYLHSP
eukprot:SAG31_NODE_7_length_42755_cov_130.245728_29_plen_118_part_00